MRFCRLLHFTEYRNSHKNAAAQRPKKSEAELLAESTEEYYRDFGLQETDRALRATTRKAVNPQDNSSRGIFSPRSVSSPRERYPVNTKSPTLNPPFRHTDHRQIKSIDTSDIVSESQELSTEDSELTPLSSSSPEHLPGQSGQNKPSSRDSVEMSGRPRAGRGGTGRDNRANDDFESDLTRQMNEGLRKINDLIQETRINDEKVKALNTELGKKDRGVS